MLYSQVVGVGSFFSVCVFLGSPSAGAGEKFFRPTIEPYNITRTTPVGIAAYRSALTLDWLAAEDHRQRELVSAFESQPVLSNKLISSDCVAYPRPSAGTVARLMLEMIKNLEGDSDNRSIIHELFQSLIRAKLLKLESSVFENEPDLEALMKTPIELAGEPHITFPRMMAIAWMAITDPTTVKKHGWCTINRISKYINLIRPADIAKQMRAAEPIISRARFIMEDFIHHLTPLNMMKSSTPSPTTITRKFKAIIGRPRSEHSLTRPWSVYPSTGPRNRYLSTGHWNKYPLIAPRNERPPTGPQNEYPPTGLRNEYSTTGLRNVYSPTVPRNEYLSIGPRNEYSSTVPQYEYLSIGPRYEHPPSGLSNEYPPTVKARPTRASPLTPVIKQLVLGNVTPSAINLARLNTTITNELMDYDVMYGGNVISVNFKTMYLLLPALLVW